MQNDTITITDNRTNRTYTLPLFKGCIRTMDLRQIKTSDDDFGDDGLRPGVHEHRVLPEQRHLHRRRPRHSALPRLPHRATGRKMHVPRGRLPGPVSANCPPRASSTTWAADVAAHTHGPREHQEVHGRLPPRRASHGHVDEQRGGACHVLSGRPEHPRRRRSRQLQILRLVGKIPTIAAYAYRHSLGLPYVSSGQFAELHRELHEHALEDAGGAEVPAEPGAGAGAGRAVHPARGPRAELQHERHAVGGQLPGGPVRLDGGGDRRPCGGRCTAAPTSRCWSCWTRSARWRTSRRSSRR